MKGNAANKKAEKKLILQGSLIGVNLGQNAVAVVQLLMGDMLTFQSGRQDKNQCCWLLIGHLGNLPVSRRGN
jgi:hypothetical protein